MLLKSMIQHYKGQLYPMENPLCRLFFSKWPLNAFLITVPFFLINRELLHVFVSLLCQNISCFTCRVYSNILRIQDGDNFFLNYLNLNYMTCVILFVKLYLFRMS